MTTSDAPTVVVTGSSGYLGTKVVEGLKRLDANVIEIDKYNESNPIDLSNGEDKLRLSLPKDYLLIHLAFPLPGAMPSKKFEVLIDRFNSNISNWFKPKRVLFISSTAVFPIKDDANNGISPWEIYGKLKYRSEIFLKNEFDSVTILRPGTLVEVNRESSMMKFISQLRNSRFPIMPGDGDIIHPFTHTNDLVNAILTWVKSPKEVPGTFNITALHPMSFNEMSNLGRSKRILITLRVPRVLLLNIGSDRFPIGNISRWHFRALCYDYRQDSSNKYRNHCRSYETLFTS